MSGAERGKRCGVLRKVEMAEMAGREPEGTVRSLGQGKGKPE